jgi:uncharacterized protein (TIGR02328 family)
MRLWHQSLLPYLDRQRLLSQHRECAALRGRGWGKKHSVVDYVFTYAPDELVAYHKLVMDEMERRGYHPDRTWDDPCWRGSILGREEGWSYQQTVDAIYNAALGGEMVYDEHDDAYLAECIALLKEKEAPIDWAAVEKGGITNG